MELRQVPWAAPCHGNAFLAIQSAGGTAHFLASLRTVRTPLPGVRDWLCSIWGIFSGRLQLGWGPRKCGSLLASSKDSKKISGCAQLRECRKWSHNGKDWRMKLPSTEMGKTAHRGGLWGGGRSQIYLGHVKFKMTIWLPSREFE